MQLYFCQLTAFHGFLEIGIAGLGVLTGGDGIVDNADQQHDGDGDDQCDHNIRLWALVVPGLVVILRIVAIRFHRQSFSFWNCVFHIISYFSAAGNESFLTLR